MTKFFKNLFYINIISAFLIILERKYKEYLFFFTFSVMYYLIELEIMIIFI